jgi:hypothetical protein
MATQQSRRYTVEIIAGPGPDQGNTRDSGEVIAASDDEAWGKAHTWAAENGLSEVPPDDGKDQAAKALGKFAARRGRRR